MTGTMRNWIITSELRSSCRAKDRAGRPRQPGPSLAWTVYCVELGRWGGFWTRPALIQVVQTSIRRTLPLTTARIRWMFGLNLRRVLAFTRRRMAFLPRRLMLLPKLGCFPQSSQTEPTLDLPFPRK